MLIFFAFLNRHGPFPFRGAAADRWALPESRNNDPKLPEFLIRLTRKLSLPALERRKPGGPRLSARNLALPIPLPRVKAIF